MKNKKSRWISKKLKKAVSLLGQTTITVLIALVIEEIIKKL